MIPTYQDCVNHLLDYLGSDPSDAALRDAKKSVNEAYRDLANAHTWTYLYTPVCLQTSQMTGADPSNPGISDGTTITYQNSGGEFPRMVTLYGPGGTVPSSGWPIWSQDGMLVLGHNDPTAPDFPYGASLSYFVDRLISPTVITLQEGSNPGADILIPSPYSFYRDAYPLPRDFIVQDITFIPNTFPNLQFVHPREWFRITQNEVRVGKPIYYSVLGYDREPGRHAVHFSPIPDIKYEIHYAYKRLPRAVRIYAYSTGVVSIDADMVTVMGTHGLHLPKPWRATRSFGSVRRAIPFRLLISIGMTPTSTRH